MKIFSTLPWVLSALLLCAWPSWAKSEGTLFRAYLSGAGSDTNPCTLAQPCRLLPAALEQTRDGGEVWMLDSANYNTAGVSIVQNVTIEAAPGILGSFIAPKNGSAFSISGAVLVVLRNVMFSNPGEGIEGVVVIGGGSLTVEDSQFSGFPQGAISFQGMQLNAYRTGFFGNSPAISLGDPSVAPVNAVVDQCAITASLDEGYEGIYATNANVIVRNTTIADSMYGIYVDGTATAAVTLDHDSFLGSEYAVLIDSSGQGSSQPSYVYTLGNNFFINNYMNVSDQTRFKMVANQ